MNTAFKVARYVIPWPAYVAGPWLFLVMVFLINLLIAAGIPLRPGTQYQTGALVSIYLLMLIYTAAVSYQLTPAALALGISRRSAYAGTAILVLVQAAVSAAGLTVLRLVEGATSGWGLAMHFFRVPYLFAGPWYLTWLTSFVGLFLMGVWGIWFGLIYRRWNLSGLLGFSAIQALVPAVAIVIAFRANAWHSIAHFFTTLTIDGLTGLLAALTVVLLVGGFATIRRVTV
jgi:hypothetical protein